MQGGKYRIIKVLGQGGFGITYLAENTLLACYVAIKEFFIEQCCKREPSSRRIFVPLATHRDLVIRHKAKFIKEARTLFRLEHPGIIRVHDIFEENSTAYYVMEYVEGESLESFTTRCGTIPEAKAIEYIKEVGEALTYLHSLNINHLDVKPDNIMIRHRDGRILLIDFGVAKRYDALTYHGTTTTPVGISHGYSPAEQYMQHGVQDFSPQSDVYALAATLYKLLTGVTPPEAIEVQCHGLPVDRLAMMRVSQRTIDAIVAAMKGYRERTQTVSEFVENLLSRARTHTSSVSSLMVLGIFFGGVAVLVGLFLVAYLALQKKDASESVFAETSTYSSFPVADDTPNRINSHPEEVSTGESASRTVTLEEFEKARAEVEKAAKEAKESEQKRIAAEKAEAEKAAPEKKQEVEQKQKEQRAEQTKENNKAKSIVVRRIRFLLNDMQTYTGKKQSSASKFMEDRYWEINVQIKELAKVSPKEALELAKCVNETAENGQPLITLVSEIEGTYVSTLVAIHQIKKALDIVNSIPGVK